MVLWRERRADHQDSGEELRSVRQRLKKVRAQRDRLRARLPQRVAPVLAGVLAPDQLRSLAVHVVRETGA